jgi:hypothetical protein
MPGSEIYEHGVTFPHIPDSVKAKYAIDGLYLRPFGLFEDDLDIDFNNESRPQLVTQILECCTRVRQGRITDQAFFWDLTIGKRIECLLNIATLESSSVLSVGVRCLNEACQEQMEVDISMSEFASLQNQNGDADDFMVQVDNKNLRIRKPTGRDQIEWQKLSLPDEDATARAMIRTLILEVEYDEIPDTWVQAISETMEEVDPLVNFGLLTYCPNCGEECHYELDLERLSLRELHRIQRDLLQAVHRLASRYNWSEQQIISLPPWRRSHYLTLVDREENR